MDSKLDLFFHTLDDSQFQDLLAPVGFADPRAAQRALLHLAADARLRPTFAACLPDLLLRLSSVASPDRVLVNLGRLVDGNGDPAALCHALATDARLLELLVTLFAGSQFLTEILLRHPEYIAWLQDRRRLADLKSAAQFGAEARAVLASESEIEGQIDALRRYQRAELLRIGACDLLGMLDVPTVTTQLARLADSLVAVGLDIAAAQAHVAPAGFVVIAMGKLGGDELNYSSDIDLLFLACEDPMAYRRLGERLIDALARVTTEGFLYRVDMRLRPWGGAGPLVTSFEGYMAYLRQSARLWEKQALLKARVVAGNVAAGQALLQQIAPLLFDTPVETVRADVREMKERIESELFLQGRDWGEVKLGKGSIRDVEFVTQYLQLVQGAQHPEIRSSNTLDALRRLAACVLLTPREYRVLTDGYTFLRPVEHYLQMMDYHQTHALPHDPRELGYLARRLGFQGAEAGEHFLTRYQQQSDAIYAVYQRYLKPEDVTMPADPQPAPLDVRRHMERMAPSYEATFSEAEIRRHAELAEALDRRNLVEVEALPLAPEGWRVTIVAYDYPGELSLICGLLFVFGFSIRDGHVFTYEPLRGAPMAESSDAERVQARRKIVDVFSVHSVLGNDSTEVWTRYVHDLAALLRRLEAGEQREAQGELVKRVAVTLQDIPGAATTLQPIDIEIDNQVSERYTALYIDAPDTIGFLYEFTNALALSGVHIALVTVDSVGNRVRDVFYLTDMRGKKIESPEKQRELRAATVLIKHFSHLLPHSPNPESALLHFRELLEQLLSSPNWPDEFATLERPEVLGALARLLGVSDFLWDDFLRMQHTNLFPVVRDVDALASARSVAQLQRDLDAALGAAPDFEARCAALNDFKDREMFRIDMRHIQGYVQDLGQFSAELTDLTEVVVGAAYALCEGALRALYGAPHTPQGQPCPMTVCALGKCGGRELGFASDIELMLVYAGNGQTSGPTVITAAEFYEKVLEEFLRTIRARREGIFEVDLRLRPYGQAGSLAVALDAFRRYFGPGGAAWPYERQALIKLRPIAGDQALGQQLLALRDEYVYGGEAFDVAAMRAMRERQIRHLVTAGTTNAKFSPGGLVDAEYLVQGLQIRYARDDAGLRLTNTREAIEALAAAGKLAPADHIRLRDAYVFIRQLIDALRMVRGNARDLTVPPADSEEFAFLARRLGYARDLARLHDDVTGHTLGIQELSKRLLNV